MEFVPFPKLSRLSRDVVVTEKLDGTNAQVTFDDDMNMFVGSRKRWIKPGDDNFGFAAWCYDNKEELMKLGPGSHFGEWWGKGIQRGYDLQEKRFSLFNSARWADDAVRPTCCGVVPVLHVGILDTDFIDVILKDLYENGSVASPGFKNPEGVVVYHTHSGMLFKKTLDSNDKHKWEVT